MFFLSNEELIALLCESDPYQLEKHLRKSFDGLYKLHVDEGGEVEAVVSIENEVVALKSKLSTANARISIENWLLQVSILLLSNF